MTGDSLTHGLVVSSEGLGRQRSLHPYTLVLSELLNNTFPSDKEKVTVVEAGISGELASSMVYRFPLVVEETNPRVAIILGGTNDLGRHSTAIDIVRNLAQLHNVTLRRSGGELSHDEQYGNSHFSVAVTIPQLAWLRYMTEEKAAIHEEKRKQINQMLRLMAAQCPSRIALLDLETAFDQTREGHVNDKYWSIDFVHFSPLGYDEIGRMAFGVLERFQVDSTPSASAMAGSDRSCFDYLAAVATEQSDPS